MTNAIRKSLPITVVMLVLGGAIACGGAGEGSSAAGETAAPPAAQSAAPATADFTAADLEAYAKGMTREIAAVRAAKSEPEKWDTATVPLGAEAAGLAVDRYRAVREAVNEVFKTLDFQGKIDGPMQIDLTRVDEATKARIGRDPFNDLSSGAAAALRGAMDRLVPIWIEYVRLTAVAG